LKKDSYQSIASAMPTAAEARAALAAEACPAAAAGFKLRGVMACLKACPDTNPFQTQPPPEEEGSPLKGTLN
jgi:hypothetical protein